MASHPLTSIKPAHDASVASYHDLRSLNAIRERSSNDKEGALLEAARQFESHFLKSLIKTMRDANDAFGNNDLFDSENVDFYQEMHDEQLASALSAKNSLGLAELMVQQLSGKISTPLNPGSPMTKTPKLDIDSASPAREMESVIPTAVSQNSSLQEPTFSSRTDFVSKLLPHAEKAGKALNVEPSVLLAQAALETGWGAKSGSSDSGVKLFNIKAGSSYQGQSVAQKTLEFESGVPKLVNASFRTYKDFEAAFDDYVSFLQNSPRYNDALAHSGNSEKFVDGLQSAGYATDPQYANKIKQIMAGETFRDALNEARNLLRKL